MANVRQTGADVGDVPELLRQHVARARLKEGDVAPWGSVWCAVGRAPLNAEGVDAAAPASLVGRLVGPADRIDLAAPRRTPCSDLYAPATPNTLVRGADGRLYRPFDAEAALARAASVHAARRVSASLHPAQSQQLISAFYVLCVEREDADATTREALRLVLYRYLVQQGYLARWLGKYDQCGAHVGNGDRFRHFARMAQYAPERLPSTVLNRLCGEDGKLHARGAKGRSQV